MDYPMVLSFRGEVMRPGENGWTQAAIDHMTELYEEEKQASESYLSLPGIEMLKRGCRVPNRNHELLVTYMTKAWREAQHLTI